MKPPSIVDTLKIIQKKNMLKALRSDATELSTLLKTDEDIAVLGGILSESNSLSTVNLSKIGNVRLQLLLPFLIKNSNIETLDLSYNNIAMNVICQKRKDFEPFLLNFADLISPVMTAEMIKSKIYQQILSLLRLNCVDNADKSVREKIENEKCDLKKRLKSEAFVLLEQIEKNLLAGGNPQIIEAIHPLTQEATFHIEIPIQQPPIINELAFLIWENKTLKILKLNDNYLNEKDVATLLIALEKNTTLTEIHLLNNRINAEGRKRIAEFQSSSKNKSKCIIKLDVDEPKKVISEGGEPSAQKKMRTEAAKGHPITLEYLSFTGALGLPSFLNSVGLSPSLSLPISDFSDMPSLEPDFSTGKEGAGSEANHTLADGNCAFNAVTLGICHLLKNGEMKINVELEAIVAEKFPTEIKKFNEVSVWLKQEQDTAKLQKLLSPLFRNLAVVYIRKNYAQFSETFEQGLKSAFAQYCSLGEKDETYAVHPHILAKFVDLKKQQEELIRNCKSAVENQLIMEQLDYTLMTWWKAEPNAKERDEGMHQYFANLQRSAEGAADLRTWGSEVEIDAIAKCLEITIKNKKQGGKTQILGWGSGIVNNLSPDEVRHLDALSIGSVLTNHFRIECDKATLEKILRIQRLSEAEIKFLDEQGRKEILDFINMKIIPTRLLPSNSFFADICAKLEKTGVLYCKAISANSVVMDFVALKRLNYLVKPIAESLIAKVLQAYNANIPSFEITHLGAHWTYMPASDVSSIASATASAAQSAASTIQGKRKFA